MLYLSSNDRQQLLDWAKEARDRECCGLLRGAGFRVAAVELAKNVAANPARHFEINPATLIAAHKDARAGGIPLLGYFHSHPNGHAAPSEEDIAQASPDGRIWLIITSHKVTAWQPVVKQGQVTGFSPISVAIEG